MSFEVYPEKKLPLARGSYWDYFSILTYPDNGGAGPTKECPTGFRDVHDAAECESLARSTGEFSLAPSLFPSRASYDLSLCIGLEWVSKLSNDANWIHGCFEWYSGTAWQAQWSSKRVYWNDRLEWSDCATEGGYCNCPDGTTRYGSGSSWGEYKTGSQSCNNDNFGDPAYGVVKKCQCGAPFTTGKIGGHKICVTASNMLPSGMGCWQMTTKESCCGFVDGRSVYKGQPCMWNGDYWDDNPSGDKWRCDIKSVVDESKDQCGLQDGSGKGDGCYDANWWDTFNSAGWSECADGYAIVGLYFSDCNELYCLEQARCCPVAYFEPDMGSCTEGDVWGKFDDNGDDHYFKCTDSDYSYIKGLYRTDGNDL